MKKIYLFSLIMILSSCRYFNVSPVNGITFKNLSEQPVSSELVGLWEVDSFSYDLIKKNGYNDAKVQLKFNEDGTFEAIDFPDFVNSFKDLKEHKLYHYKGNWKTEKDFEGEKWILNLAFIGNKLCENSFSTSYDLYLEDNKLVIWKFIGDPDSGERLLFKKR